MAFIDEVKIELRAGKGGDGVVRWRREKFIPKGGPAGGDGGRGGDVYISAIKDNMYLQRYSGLNSLSAEAGQDGGSKSLDGKNGEDLIVKVPLGTLVTNLDTGEQWDIDHLDEDVKVLSGGQGGLGNTHFKSSTNTVPQEQTDGTEGKRGTFVFELRLIADVGLIGEPNAGKSTLLNFLTNAKSKTADYAFTTLEPHLGSFYNYILADVPGLIEGASSGKGLGHKFLRHIQRTRLLAHCVSLDNEDIKATYEKIRRELYQYDSELAEKKELIILTKADTVDKEVIKKAKEIFPQAIVVSVLDDSLKKALEERLLKELEEIIKV